MTMHRSELEAWLDDNWTPEQIDAIEQDYRAWESDNPGASDEDQTAMLTAIAQYRDGVLDIAELSRADLDAQAAAANARRALKSAAIVLHLIEGSGKGINESQLARLAGVQRMTVRAWLGKR